MAILRTNSILLLLVVVFTLLCLIAATHKIDLDRDSNEMIGLEVINEPVPCSESVMGRISCTLRSRKLE